MQKTKLVWTTIIIIASFVLLIPTTVQAQNNKDKKVSTPEAKFALLVGINDYIGGVNDLYGTHNDVGMVKDLLTSENFGFVEKISDSSIKDAPCGKQTNDSQIKTLCSKQATKEGIINTFKEYLIENARKYKEDNKVTPDKGATIVFYYSGHGFHIPDDQEDEEPDGEDETIVPADGEWDDHESQIRDDEFNKLANDLRQYTSNITFIFDSCHSGTISRGNGSKSFKGGSSSKSKSNGSRGGEDARLTDGITFNTNYVTISGSLPNQEAFEDDFPNPNKPTEIRRGGVLTYFLVEYLKSNPGATYREAINYVRNGADIRGKPQTPQAEGSIDNIVFGSTKKGTKIPIFPVCNQGKCSTVVKDKDKNGKEFEFHWIEMKVGQLVGARKGGIIAVYSPKARELVGDENKIGMGTIISSDQFKSVAEVTITDTKFKKIPGDAQIILVTPNFTDAKRVIALDFVAGNKGKEANVDAGNQRLQELSKRLSDSPYFTLSDKSNLLQMLNLQSTTNKSSNFDWDIAIVRSSFKDFKTSIEQKTVKQIGANNKAVANKGNAPNDEDIGFFLSDKNGDPLYNFWLDINDKNAAAQLQSVLEKHIRLENLRVLKNDGSSLSNNIKVNFVRVKDFSIQKFSSEGMPLECTAIDYDQKKIKEDQAKTTPQIMFAERRSPGVGTDAGLNGDGYYFRITNNSKERLHVYVYSLSPDGEIALLLPAEGIGEEIKPGETIKTYGENQCGVFFHTKQKSDIGRETFKFIISSQEFPGELLSQDKIANITGRRGGNSLLTSFLTRVKTQEGNSRGPEQWGGSASTWTTIDRDVEIIP